MPPVRSPRHLALGRAIRKHRAPLEISQERLADLAGIDRTYLSGIERGEREPTYGVLLKVADALGTPLSQLQLDAEQTTGVDAPATP